MRKLGTPREENGPDGYPKPGMNPEFDRLAALAAERARPAAERARAFLKQLEKRLREKAADKA